MDSHNPEEGVNEREERIQRTKESNEKAKGNQRDGVGAESGWHIMK